MTDESYRGRPEIPEKPSLLIWKEKENEANSGILVEKVKKKFLSFQEYVSRAGKRTAVSCSLRVRVYENACHCPHCAAHGPQREHERRVLRSARKKVLHAWSPIVVSARYGIRWATVPFWLPIFNPYEWKSLSMPMAPVSIKRLRHRVTPGERNGRYRRNIREDWCHWTGRTRELLGGNLKCR